MVAHCVRSTLERRHPPQTPPAAGEPAGQGGRGAGGTGRPWCGPDKAVEVRAEEGAGGVGRRGPSALGAQTGPVRDDPAPKFMLDDFYVSLTSANTCQVVVAKPQSSPCFPLSTRKFLRKSSTGCFQSPEVAATPPQSASPNLQETAPRGAGHGVVARGRAGARPCGRATLHSRVHVWPLSLRPFAAVASGGVVAQSDCGPPHFLRARPTCAPARVCTWQRQSSPSCYGAANVRV